MMTTQTGFSTPPRRNRVPASLSEVQLMLPLNLPIDEAWASRERMGRGAAKIDSEARWFSGRSRPRRMDFLRVCPINAAVDSWASNDDDARKIAASLTAARAELHEQAKRRKAKQASPQAPSGTTRL